MDNRPRNDPRPQRDNRPRTPEVPPPIEEVADRERPMDAHELADQEEMIRKNSEVATQLGIQSEPVVYKRGAALKKLLKKHLTIETETEAEEGEVGEA
jgi:hypothetical protein